MDNSLDGRLKDAQSLADGGRYTESAEAFESVFNQDPSNSEALTALAGVMAELGQPEASLALLADSVDEADPNPATLVRIADQLEDAGRFSEATDFLLCALLQTPEDVGLRARTESALKSLGRLDQVEWLQSGGEGELPVSQEAAVQH
jgi:thioredoxin-like negative regulator of GroEL